MLRLLVTRLGCTGSVQKQLLVTSKASYVRGYWPEPITQQKLDEFLKDINYFDEPRRLINIGLKLPEPVTQKDEQLLAESKESGAHLRASTSPTNQAAKIEPEKLDEVFDVLGKETTSEQLDLDDIPLTGEQIRPLAIKYGIYRDLFSQSPYVPETEDIKFTPAQAERLNKLVPYHWITDQPFARVQRKPKEPEPLNYFDSVTGLSARFVKDDVQNDDEKREEQDQEKILTAHRSYYGNIIPASEAQQKPSITLDGKLTQTRDEGSLNDKEFDNWRPGSVSLANFDAQTIDKLYHTVILLNLDPPACGDATLHWMVANIKPKTTEGNLITTTGEELCDYLPVYGVRGFGYSRYVFLAFQHDSPLDINDYKIDKFTLESRRFNTRSFLETNRSANLTPVGLSWFQTTWDESSNQVFHNFMNTRAPVYEHVQQKETQQEAKAYPGKIPFNVYLDYRRDKKEVNQQVLLERLRKTDPFDGYKNQYVPPKVPETVFDDEKMPSWMNAVMFKKRNKVGYWRGLRPASALLPLDNNADLDYPLRPREASSRVPPEFPNEYPAKIKYKPKSESPLSRPENEFQNVYIQENHKIDMEWVKQMMAKADKQAVSKGESKPRKQKQKSSQ